MEKKELENSRSFSNLTEQWKTDLLKHCPALSVDHPRTMV